MANKLPLVDLEGKKVGEVELPSIFDELVRPDIIKRAVLAIQSHNRQPYGAFGEAGKRPSAKLYKRRRVYRTSYGYGISRVPRKILSKSGSQFFWRGAFIPGTVGGRRAHPPKALKNWSLKINKTERKKAIRSALAACLKVDLVSKKERVPENYPFVIVDDFENLKKTKDVFNALKKLGFGEELNRIKERKIRAGKGKARGRKYVKKVGPLLITSKKSDVLKAVKNVGLDAVDVSSLNSELLAPGAVPGRIIIITKSAVEKMRESKLFV